MEDKPVITEEKTVMFYGDEIVAVKDEDGIWVPIRRLCDNLGLDWSGQRQRINRHEVLRDALRSVGVTPTDLTSKFAPSQSEMLCLPLDMIPGWLFGIPAGRVKEEIRTKLLRYQRECFRVLWDAFKSDLLPAPLQDDRPLTPAEQALATVEALHSLAKQQVTMERWLGHHDTRLDTVEDGVIQAHERIDQAAEAFKSIHLRVFGKHQLITDEQAVEIAELVKAVAMALTEKAPDKNHYQSIWGELHRRYRVASYKRVPAAKFGKVVGWLEEWLKEIA